MTVAKSNFDSHMLQCDEAIKIYEYLEKSRYPADFGLRYVWIASVSALDHYISELIVEKATEQFANGGELSGRISNETVPISSLLQMHSAPPAQAVVEFREILRQTVRFRTFQKADDIADGLAFIWNEKHKWKRISGFIGQNPKSARHKLNGICRRRDLIAHNADYNEATGALTACSRSDAQEVCSYVSNIVDAIDNLVT